MTHWWTASQQRGLLIVLAVLIAILAIRLSMQRMTVGEPEQQQGHAADRLADRVDPNTATAAELAAIPRLGESHAAAIVEFREKYGREHPGQVAFMRPSDLEQVRGIGAATAEMMQGYLIFPSRPTTRLQ
jgi:competence ComEA-like helix-hairpin-helix protein